MQLFNRLYLLIPFLFFLSCDQNTKETKKVASTQNEKDDSETYVSFFNLLATPEKYHEKKVGLVGYLNLEFEGNNLYFHKEDYDKQIFTNRIWINVPPENALTDSLVPRNIIMQCNKNYVIVCGTFDMTDRGHMGMSMGGIKNIYIMHINRIYH